MLLCRRSAVRACRAASLAALCVSTALWASSSNAASINTQAFQPSPTAGDLLSVLTTRTDQAMGLEVGLALHFTQGALGFVGQGPSPGLELVEKTVDSRIMAEILAGFTPIERLQVGLAIPFVLAGTTSDTHFTSAGDTSGFAMGEIRLSVKGIALRERVFGLGFEGNLTLPTANDETLSGNGFGGGLRVIPDFQFGRMVISLNLGAYFRAGKATITATDGITTTTLLSVGNELVAGLGGELRIIDPLSLVGEIYMRTALDDLFGSDGNNQLEGMAGVRWHPIAQVSVTAGAGGGTPIFEGYGTSRLRVFADARWSWGPTADADNDGVPDRRDKCDILPEDRDGFQDDDGCPDPDNDGDGVLDADDRCPNEPEDMDGMDDEDGCPDLDNDGDGIADDRDKCPEVAEDPDGFEDDDGCPDLDNDGDGIADADDRCPDVPETRNGFADDDGCPDFPGIQADGDRIVLADPIPFDPKTNQPSPTSFVLLRNLARFIQANPSWKRIRIDVHVGGRDRDAVALLAASQARAEALIRFLVIEGVPPHRLEAHGVGITQPVADNKTKAGRAANERVEFIIVK
ncbi:MAG: OmpA family protein [Deltaproteobacteria bacterium]|nr:OmpA family protein [Deltaproteobacteria bacterium]MCB9786499.1 OmpA family protein [Deltaproteobacteria bacterium]